jgi:hypothetical protein
MVGGDWITLALNREKRKWFSEHGNTFSGSINCGKFLDKLKSHRFLRTRFYKINMELEFNVKF